MKNTKKGRPLNWRPMLPHHKVKRFKSLSDTTITKIDLRAMDTPIFDQGQEGSCTMNAGCALFDFLKKKSGVNITTSRNFGYWVERAFDGDKSVDGGSSLSTCSQVFLEKGVCLESTWTYGSNTLYPEPPPSAWGEATRYKIKERISINQDASSLKKVLTYEQPFIFGIAVYESFEEAINGVIPMPGDLEQLLGGHALCCVGYDDDNQWFIVRNSWGVGWGDQGYCYIPYSYLTSSALASDFWTFSI